MHFVCINISCSVKILKLDFLLKFPGKYLGDNSPDLSTYRTNLFHRQTRCDAPNLMQMAQGDCVHSSQTLGSLENWFLHFYTMYKCTLFTQTYYKL